VAPHDLLAGLGILAGLVGVIVVVFPGLLLIVGSVALWALVEKDLAGWIALVAAVAVAVVVTVLKYLHPGRKLKEIGVPTRHLLIALAVALVGLFVIPVVGAFLGFAVTLYLLERWKRGGDQARASTIATLKAIALSIGIELAGGFVIAAIWLAAAIWG
jgi:hypothetical protein